MKRGNVVTVAAAGDYGNPRPAEMLFEAVRVRAYFI
jgi:hypothetical protein